MSLFTADITLVSLAIWAERDEPWGRSVSTTTAKTRVKTPGDEEGPALVKGLFGDGHLRRRRRPGPGRSQVAGPMRDFTSEAMPAAQLRLGGPGQAERTRGFSSANGVARRPPIAPWCR